MQELAQLGAKFEENVLDAMNAWSRHVTDPAELAGINPVIVEQARARAAEQGLDGWVFALEQPTYVAVITDADSEALRRDFYEAWSTRASDRGPSAGKFDNTPVMRNDPRVAPRGGAAARFPELRRVRARDAHGAVQPGGVRFPARAGARREAGRAARIRRARELRRPQAQCLGRGLLRREAAGRSCSRSRRKSCGRISRCRACSTACSRSAERLFGVKIVERTRRAGVARGRALLRDPAMPAGKVRAGFYLDACARPKKRAGAWMDDCVGRKDFGAEHTHPGGLPGLQFPAGRAPASRRCSRTTTS